MPGPVFPKFGSLLDTMTKRSPFGSHEKSSTVSENSHISARLRVEGYRLSLEFYDFYGIVFFAHSEYFEIAEECLPCLRMPVNLDAEKVTLVLPVELALIQI
jgi:hypothetical protein